MLRKPWLFQVQQKNIYELYREIQKSVIDRENEFITLIRNQLNFNLHFTDFEFRSENDLVQMFKEAKRREKESKTLSEKDLITINEYRSNDCGACDICVKGQEEPNHTSFTDGEEKPLIYSPETEAKLVIFIFACHVLCFSLFKVMENMIKE